MTDQVSATPGGNASNKNTLRVPSPTFGSSGNSSKSGKTLSVATPTNSTTARAKKALLPGRSLMDWIRLANSGEPMTNLRGQMRGVTPAELAKHNSESDCWMSIHDQVYDVTRYLEYHPGGIDELMRGAGQDATELFNEAHRWVNYSSMLSKCLVGPLVIPRSTVRRRKTMDPQAASVHVKQFAALAPPRPPAERPRWDWTEDDTALVLIIRYPQPVPSSLYLSLSFADSRMKLHTTLVPRSHNFYFNVNSKLEWTPGELPTANGEECRLVLHKREPGTRVPNIGQVVRDEWKLVKDTLLAFHKSRVVSRTEVTHDTLLFCMEWPEGFYIPIPVGHHIRLRVAIEGIELARSYTPVCSSLLEPALTPEELRGRQFYLMVKIYPDGCLTPHLAEYHADSHLSVSSPEGTFNPSLPGFRQCRHLLLLAAGTGFTPMARLIRAALVDAPEDEVTVQLVFFNKRTRDIMWREQLDGVQERFPNRMSVVYVLSEPDDDWTGPKGRISASLLEEHVPQAKEPEALKKMFACVCGPDAFTDTSVSLLSSTLNLAESQIHAFKG